MTVHWIKGHVEHPGNERVDELSKAAKSRDTICLLVKLTSRPAKGYLLPCAMQECQSRLDISTTGRFAYALYPMVSTMRL